MFKLEVIGNLGADATIKGESGKEFVSFNVAHTDRWTDDAGTKHETTTWVQCIINDTKSKVCQYLVKGKTVYVRGSARLRVYSSEKERRMVAGVTLNVQDIELIGGQVDEVPRKLNDDKGLLYPIYKAYYIDPRLDPKPSQLMDSQLHLYNVDNNGFVTRQPAENAQQSDTASVDTETTNS